MKSWEVLTQYLLKLLDIHDARVTYKKTEHTCYIAINPKSTDYGKLVGKKGKFLEALNGLAAKIEIKGRTGNFIPVKPNDKTLADRRDWKHKKVWPITEFLQIADVILETCCDNMSIDVIDFEGGDTRVEVTASDYKSTQYAEEVLTRLGTHSGRKVEIIYYEREAQNTKAI